MDGAPGSTAQHTFGFGRALESCFSFLQQQYRLVSSDDQVVAALPVMRFSVGGRLQAIQCLPFRMYGAPLIDPAYPEQEMLIAAVAAEIDAEGPPPRPPPPASSEPEQRSGAAVVNEMCGPRSDS